MKGLNLCGVQKRKFKQTTDSDHRLAIAPKVLNQDFATHLPNTKWVGDITYIQVKQRWLYLAVVIDLYSRRVVGWAFYPNKVNESTRSWCVMRSRWR